MRLRTSDAPDGEGGNKWQRTGVNDGLLTAIAPAAEAAPVSSPEGRPAAQSRPSLCHYGSGADPKIGVRRLGASPSDDPDWSHKM
jgi:hypothetical protein